MNYNGMTDDTVDRKHRSFIEFQNALKAPPGSAPVSFSQGVEANMARNPTPDAIQDLAQYITDDSMSLAPQSVPQVFSGVNECNTSYPSGSYEYTELHSQREVPTDSRHSSVSGHSDYSNSSQSMNCMISGNIQLTAYDAEGYRPNLESCELFRNPAMFDDSPDMPNLALQTSPQPLPLIPKRESKPRKASEGLYTERQTLAELQRRQQEQQLQGLLASQAQAQAQLLEQSEIDVVSVEDPGVSTSHLNPNIPRPQPVYQIPEEDRQEPGSSTSSSNGGTSGNARGYDRSLKDDFIFKVETAVAKFPKGYCSETMSKEFRSLKRALNDERDRSYISEEVQRKYIKLGEEKNGPVKKRRAKLSSYKANGDMLIKYLSTFKQEIEQRISAFEDQLVPYEQ